MKISIEPEPPSNLRWYVKTIYSYIADFSEEDYDDLIEYIRCLWTMRVQKEKRDLKRLELIRILKTRNQKNIFEEKQKLFAQLALLERVTGSSPFWESAESI